MIELSSNQSTKNSTIADEYVLRKQREIRVDESLPDRWLGFRIEGRQSILYQSFLGGIGVIEEGRGQTAVEGFVDSNEVLRWGVGYEAGCDVREVLVPVALLN